MATGLAVPGGSKDPPKGSNTQRRLLEYRLDDDARYRVGHQTLDRVLGELNPPTPAASVPKRATEMGLSSMLDDEKTRLGKRGYDNRVFLASWDFMGKTTVNPVEAGQEVSLGDRAIPFPAPNPANLAQQVAAVHTAMEGAVARDAILLEAEAMEMQFVRDLGMDVDRHGATLQVIDVVSNVVGVPLYLLKHRFDVPRPNDVDPQLKPIIAVPKHASYPGGHSTFAMALAVVLGAVTGATYFQKNRLTAIARQIGKNRMDAGLHTEQDTTAGNLLGEAVGHWMVDMGAAGHIDYPAWGVLFVQASNEWQ